MIIDNTFDITLAKELEKDFRHLKLIVILTYLMNALFFIFTRYEMNVMKKELMSLQTSVPSSNIVSDEQTLITDDSVNHDMIEKTTTWSSWLSSLDVKHVLIAVAVTSVFVYFGVNYYNNNSSLSDNPCNFSSGIDQASQTATSVGSRLIVPIDEKAVQTSTFGPASESTMSIGGQNFKADLAELWVKSSHPYNDVAITADLVSAPSDVSSGMMLQDFMKNINIFRRSDDPSYFDASSHVEGIFSLKTVGKVISLIIPVGASELFTGNVIKAAVDVGGSVGSEVSVPVPKDVPESNKSMFDCSSLKPFLNSSLDYLKLTLSSVITAVSARLSFLADFSSDSNGIGSDQSAIASTESGCLKRVRFNDSHTTIVEFDSSGNPVSQGDHVLDTCLGSADSVHNPSSILDQPDDLNAKEDGGSSCTQVSSIIKMINRMSGR